MKISDVTCPSCSASYEVAESLSARGKPGRAHCTICGDVLESWDEPRLRAYRLAFPLEHKHARAPAPPAPACR